jgi:predicted nucleotidyltransferase
LKISAIIAEYNPIHNGHVFHINKTKELSNCDGIIGIMSGNFVQRGQPALIDKWSRSKLAVLNGIDLVIELPAIYSISSAEFFSYGAVSLLNNLNVVDSLCFGSESGNLELINYVAQLLQSPPSEYSDLLKTYISSGLPYFTARSKALLTFLSKKSDINLTNSIDTLLSTSNNILAIEYCKSLIKLNSTIRPLTIKREGDKYNERDIKSNFPSATAIRLQLENKNNLETLINYLPISTYKELSYMLYNSYDFTFPHNIFEFLKYKCITIPNNLDKIPDANEGLHNKIYKSIINCKNFDELMYSIKSKRYSYTRLSRILCQYFIGFENYKTEILRKNPCPYARVLAFNKKGIEILRYIKGNSSIPVFTKLPKYKDSNECLKLDILATKAYSIINKNIDPLWDYLKSPFIL